MSKKIYTGIGLVVICFLTLELSIFLFSKTSFGKSRLRGNIPGYSLDNINKKFWGEYNARFGVWHTPNSSYKHTKSCFQVVYQANFYGANDIPRIIKSKKERVLILGDSFMEGYGLAREKRLSNLLEKETGTEHLNFALSGYFGTTQYYLVYKHLAKNFSHNKVLIGILPYNDFQDNDLQVGKIIHAQEYRPYFVGDYPNYELMYHVDSIYSAKQRDSSYEAGLIKLIMEFSFTSNAIKLIIEEISYRMASYDDPNNPYALLKTKGLPFSGYYEFREKDFQLMRFTLEKILAEAEGKEIVIALLPTMQDLMLYSKYGDAPLAKRFRQFSQETGVKVIDLLPYMHDYTKDWDKYYFPCDYHWNAYGNQVASEYLLNKM